MEKTIPLHKQKPDISIWGKSGHFYFALTAIFIKKSGELSVRNSYKTPSIAMEKPTAEILSGFAMGADESIKNIFETMPTAPIDQPITNRALGRSLSSVLMIQINAVTQMMPAIISDSFISGFINLFLYVSNDKAVRRKRSVAKFASKRVYC